MLNDCRSALTVPSSRILYFGHGRQPADGVRYIRPCTAQRSAWEIPKRPSPASAPCAGGRAGKSPVISPAIRSLPFTNTPLQSSVPEHDDAFCTQRRCTPPPVEFGQKGRTDACTTSIPAKSPSTTETPSGRGDTDDPLPQPDLISPLLFRTHL